MKKLFLVLIFFVGTHSTYAQKEKSVMSLLMECYETYYDLKAPIKQNKPVEQNELPPTIIKTPTCPPEPEEFYNFFNTTVIAFSALREGENVKTFSFNDSLCSPLKQKLKITSSYGMRNGKKHFGVDFKLNTGDAVRSIFCGKVRVAKWDNAYGYVLVIRHYNMSETVYAHLKKILVSENQEIEVGQVIGLGGNTGRSTGPHLHFELRYKGFPINPIVNGKFLTRIPVE